MKDLIVRDKVIIDAILIFQCFVYYRWRFTPLIGTGMDHIYYKFKYFFIHICTSIIKFIYSDYH